MLPVQPKSLSLEKSNLELFQDSISDPLAFIDDMFKGSEDMILSLEVSSRREVWEEEVNYPLKMAKETTSKVDGETSLLSPPKPIVEASEQNEKLKKAVREEDEESVG